MDISDETRRIQCQCQLQCHRLTPIVQRVISGVCQTFCAKRVTCETFVAQTQISFSRISATAAWSLCICICIKAGKC